MASPEEIIKGLQLEVNTLRTLVDARRQQDELEQGMLTDPNLEGSSSEFNFPLAPTVTVRKHKEPHVPIGTSTPRPDKQECTFQSFDSPIPKKASVVGQASSSNSNPDSTHSSDYASNFSYDMLQKKLDDAEKALAMKVKENEELGKEITSLNNKLHQLQTDTKKIEEMYLGQLKEAREKIKEMTHQFKTDKRNLEVQLEGEKCHNADLLTAVVVADRMASEAGERELKLADEVKTLRNQLENLTGKAKSSKEITSSVQKTDKSERIRDSIQQKGPMPNVKSIIESLERQARPGFSEPNPPPAPPIPQRETLPLRDQQLRDNQQNPPLDDKKDPLHNLMEKYTGGSMRNAMLSWCQGRISKYPNIDITNFSTSWIDGLALCALLHSYMPEKIPFNLLTPSNKTYNFQLAVKAAETVGIPNSLNIAEIVDDENPDWQKILSYVKEIYKHFEHKP